ncbi:MAG: DNA polymerase III subunit chi [Gammaproteobacteria bacterium]|nr:MAG: DNA polymerase III subunit chi [Gammaproteobacteria bacterium]
MTRVGFYVHRSADEAERLRVAAKLAEKARQHGHRVYIHTPDRALAQHMDELLWSFKPSSFLPHGLHGSGDDQDIAIGFSQEVNDHNDFLINLALTPPPFVNRFTRIAEVVCQNPEQLVALRQSWVFYRARGYALEKHDI